MPTMTELLVQAQEAVTGVQGIDLREAELRIGLTLSLIESILALVIPMAREGTNPQQEIPSVAEGLAAIEAVMKQLAAPEHPVSDATAEPKAEEGPDGTPRPE